MLSLTGLYTANSAALDVASSSTGADQLRAHLKSYSKACNSLMSITATGSKRKTGINNSQEEQTKRARLVKLHKYPSLVQLASYALESINRAAGVLKVINMIIEGKWLISSGIYVLNYS